MVLASNCLIFALCCCHISVNQYQSGQYMYICIKEKKHFRGVRHLRKSYREKLVRGTSQLCRVDYLCCLVAGRKLSLHYSNRVQTWTFTCHWAGTLNLSTFNMYISLGYVGILYIFRVTI